MKKVEGTRWTKVVCGRVRNSSPWTKTPACKRSLANPPHFPHHPQVTKAGFLKAKITVEQHQKTETYGRISGRKEA